MSRQVSEFDAEINDALLLAVTVLTATKEPLTGKELLKIAEDDVLGRCTSLTTES